MKRMGVSGVRMMSRSFMMARCIMACRFLMMPDCVLVMLCGLEMMAV
jgi:hypothetical protein